MKRSIALKWAEMLESGEYKQTKGTLRRAGRFCCLGLLCNLHAIEHPEIAKMQKKATLYMGEDALPPKAVIEWAGLHSDTGTLPTIIKTAKGGDCGALTSLNDDGGMTFPEIAKVIRKHWKEL